MMDPETFATRLQELTDEHKSITAALCRMLDIPHLKDRESERMLGYRRLRKEILDGHSHIYGGPDNPERMEGPLLDTPEYRLPDGTIVATHDWKSLPVDHVSLCEEVWTQDHYPDSYNNILEAVQKLP